MNTITSPVAARAPRLIAAPLPIEYGERITRAPRAAASPGVSSLEPSSTTISSTPGMTDRTPSSVRGKPPASFFAGRTTLTFIDTPRCCPYSAYCIRRAGLPKLACSVPRCVSL